MLLPIPRRLAVIAAATTLLAACGEKSEPTPQPTAGSSATATGRVSLTGGTTTLRLNATTARVLDVAGIKVSTAGAAQRVGDQLQFPITGGQLEAAPLGGRIEHAGGLRFSAHGQSVDATDLVLDPARGMVTANVEGKRVPLLSLDMKPSGTLDAPPRDRGERLRGGRHRRLDARAAARHHRARGGAPARPHNRVGEGLSASGGRQSRQWWRAAIATGPPARHHVSRVE